MNTRRKIIDCSVFYSNLHNESPESQLSPLCQQTVLQRYILHQMTWQLKQHRNHLRNADN